MQMENCYKILSILVTVYFFFAGTDDTLTPGKTGSDTGPEVREEIVRRLNEESEKEVKENKNTSDFELPAEICQLLDLKYPKRSFGNRPERSFCKEWYRKFPWIHYDEKRDAVFSFTCMNAANRKKLHVSTKLDDAFMASGYKNWNGKQQDLKLMNPQNVTGKQLKLLSCQGNVQILERNYPLTILRKTPKIGKFS